MKSRQANESFAGKRVGRCYDNTLALLSLKPDHILVHGFPHLTAGPNKGQMFGHAWLEFEAHGLRWCLDHSHPDKPVLREIFYSIGRINGALCKRYTLTEALYESECTGHAGPWHEVPGEALFAK